MNALAFPGVASNSAQAADIRLRVLSLGAGVQSTTLALMAAHGEIGPMPDCASLAREWWSHAYDDEPPPNDEVGEAYFERMRDHGDEFFSTMMCRVEGCDPDPTKPIGP